METSHKTSTEWPKVSGLRGWQGMGAGQSSGFRVILGSYWDNGNYYLGILLGLYWGYNGVMEKKMEATMVYWGFIGIMENKLETTI